MPILLPSSSDIPLFWLEEPPKAVPEDVLVLGIAPPPEPSGDQAADGPAPVMVAVVQAETEPLPASVALDPARDLAPVVLTAAEPVPAPADAVLIAVEPGPVAPSTDPEAAPTQPPVAAPGPEAALPPTPAFDVPPEDAFPTLADLDAILAANAGPPAEPSAAERAEVIALLGLDPALADDPVRYAEALANLPEPDADQVLELWMQDDDVGPLPPDMPDPASDWHLG